MLGYWFELLALAIIFEPFVRWDRGSAPLRPRISVHKFRDDQNIGKQFALCRQHANKCGGVRFLQLVLVLGFPRRVNVYLNVGI